MAKKLQLKDLKVKSFRTVMQKTEQKTAKGGRRSIQQIDKNDKPKVVTAIGTWTEIKSGKVVTLRLANKERTE